MKTSQITFIKSSNKAKETLFTNDLIPKASNASVAKWLKTASDEEISGLAINSGWKVDTIIVPASLANTIPQDVKAIDAKIIDSKGRPQVVSSYNLAFAKTRTEDVYAKDLETGKGVKTGQKVLAFVFHFGDATIKTYSNMLKEAYRKGELEKGDLIPFRAESCVSTHVPAKNGDPSYFFWEGATLEAGSDVMQDARDFTERREAKIATYSKAGQQKIAENRATAELKEFEEEFGY